MAWVLGKHKKPFTDAEIVKECMNEVAIALYEGTQKDDIIQKINQIPLSDSTAVRRTEILADVLLNQMKLAVKKAKCISLALDESTDNTDNAQLLVFVRFFDEERREFFEDVLGLTTLHGHTRGDDIYEAVMEMLRDREIDLKHVVSIATDGAPSMTGRERGLVSRLKVHQPDLIAYHCVIHQMVLCASLGKEYSEIMTTVMRQFFEGIICSAASLAALTALTSQRLMQNLMICFYTTMLGGLVKAKCWSVFGHYGKS